MKKLLEEDSRSVEFRALRILQPIGEFYLGVIPYNILRDITYFDIRRIFGEREFETYLGIQRPLKNKRIVELNEYVQTIDACFPTAVILSVPGVCAEFNESEAIMTLSNHLSGVGDDGPVLYANIAKVIDGQHRIEGLKGYTGPPFEINVSIFVDADVAEEAYIFSTVNLAQTRVDKSLVYDLYDLARYRSPQKLCHNIAVALDRNDGSPFKEKIKRLGRATPGREKETLTQATFIQSLIKYMSKDTNSQIRDRDLYKRGRVPDRASPGEAKRLIFRNMMIDVKDVDITNVIWNYFDAIASKWPVPWNAEIGSRMMLNRTNGFRAFMKFLRPAYLELKKPGGVPSPEEFSRVIDRVKLSDSDLTTDNFVPGSSGESSLFRTLLEQAGLAD